MTQETEAIDWNFDMNAAPKDGTLVWLSNEVMAVNTLQEDQRVLGSYGPFKSAVTKSEYVNWHSLRGDLVCPDRWAPYEGAQKSSSDHADDGAAEDADDDGHNEDESGVTKYRAIVSIEFDEDDLREFADGIGAGDRRLDAHETISGCLDNLELGTAWVEQLFEDGAPTIGRLSRGIKVEINPHK